MEPYEQQGFVPPADFTDEDVEQAAKGESEKVMKRALFASQPPELSEAQVTAAAEGRSEEIFGKKAGRDPNAKR